MNENDVKPVTGIKEQMKGSWMSLFLMIVCLFTMFLVPVFRHSGEAFSQDLGIKIYAKLGWLPLIEVTGMQPIVYDTRISTQIIFWTIILITQFLAIAAGFLLVRRKMCSFIFSILFILYISILSKDDGIFSLYSLWEMLYYILCEVIIIMKKDIIFLKRVKWELEYMHVVLDPFCYHIYNSKIKRY